MLLELIARYMKFLWMGLGVLALLKIILSYQFLDSLKGMAGFFFALFKWYSADEREMEDERSTRRSMAYLNLLTIVLYLVLLLILVASLLLIFLGR